MLLPSALGFSPHPPVSVYGTGMNDTIAAFLGTWLVYFPTSFGPHHDFGLLSGFANLTPSSLVPVFPFLAYALFMRPHISDIQ